MTFSSADDLATNNKEKQYKNMLVRHLMSSTLILTASEKIEEQWFRTFVWGWDQIKMVDVVKYDFNKRSMSIFRPFIILN